MIIVQMGHDHVAYVAGRHAEARQRIDRIERELAGALGGLFGIEPGVDQDVASACADQPDKIVQRLGRGLVRIGRQEVHVRRTRRHGRIAKRIDLVGVSHCFCLSCRGRGDTKPLQGRKVKSRRAHHKACHRLDADAS